MPSLRTIYNDDGTTNTYRDPSGRAGYNVLTPLGSGARSNTRGTRDGVVRYDTDPYAPSPPARENYSPTRNDVVRNDNAPVVPGSGTTSGMDRETARQILAGMIPGDAAQANLVYYGPPQAATPSPTIPGAPQNYYNPTYQTPPTGYNPLQYASLDTATELARLLGGGVTATAAGSGPFDLGTQYQLQMTPGGAIQNAGLVADLLRKYPPEVAMQMLNDINKNGESPLTDISGNATYTPGGGQPNTVAGGLQNILSPTNTPAQQDVNSLVNDAVRRALEAMFPTTTPTTTTPTESTWNRPDSLSGNANWLFYPTATGAGTAQNTDTTGGSNDLTSLLQMLKLLGMV